MTAAFFLRFCLQSPMCFTVKHQLVMCRAAGSGGQLLPEGQPPRLLTTPQQMPAAAGAAPNSAAGGTSATSAAAAVATGVGGSGIVLSTLPPAVSSYLARVHHPAWQEAGHLDLAQIQVVKPSPDDCLRLAGLPAVQVSLMVTGSVLLPPQVARGTARLPAVVGVVMVV